MFKGTSSVPDGDTEVRLQHVVLGNVVHDEDGLEFRVDVCDHLAKVLAVHAVHDPAGVAEEAPRDERAGRVHVIQDAVGVLQVEAAHTVWRLLDEAVAAQGRRGETSVVRTGGGQAEADAPERFKACRRAGRHVPRASRP